MPRLNDNTHATGSSRCDRPCVLRWHSRAVRRAGVGVLALSTAATLGVLAPQAAQAGPGLAASPTTTTRVIPDSTTTLSGLAVSGNSVATLQATVSTTVGTLSSRRTRT